MSNIISLMRLDTKAEIAHTETLLIFARSQPGHAEEFGTWYDEVHIPELMERFTDIVSVRRFDLTERSLRGCGSLPGESLAAYEVRASARQFWETVRTTPGLGKSPAIDYSSIVPLFA